MRSELKDLRKTLSTIVIATVATVTFGAVFAPTASAQCGYFEQHNAPPSIWEEQSRPRQAGLRPASFLQVASPDDDSDDMSIVGFWKFNFVSEGNSPAIPDGAVIDAGFVQWHRDGTEIMNSSRPPATSNFCLGIWKKTGGSTYQLNHFALSSDLSGNPIGPGNIRETVTVGHGGNTYAGTFTIDQYDRSGKVLAHVTGKVTAKRITVDTPAEDLF